MMLEKIYRNQKCQIGRSLSRIEEDGRNWLRRTKLCIKSCRATIRRRSSSMYSFLQLPVISNTQLKVVFSHILNLYPSLKSEAKFHIHKTYTGLFLSPSGTSELDCATTNTYTAERSISIGRESLKVFSCTRGLGVLVGSTARG